MTTTRIDMTEDAEVFQPTDRKCWLKREIELEHFPYNEDYRYIIELLVSRLHPC